MVQQMKRDREEEMIHRGTEYARAIKKYYKKFGRYPANLEHWKTPTDRFLRKRYKDPLTKDGKWKLLQPRRHRIRCLNWANAGYAGPAGWERRAATGAGRVHRLAGSSTATDSGAALAALREARSYGRRSSRGLEHPAQRERQQAGAGRPHYRRASDATGQRASALLWSLTRVANVECEARHRARRARPAATTAFLGHGRGRADLRRRSHRRRCQQGQGPDHPHLQQEEDLRRVEVHLQPDDGPRKRSAARTLQRANRGCRR